MSGYSTKRFVEDLGERLGAAVRRAPGGYRYPLPRYLVLGPAGTGKSTLVRSSEMPGRTHLQTGAPPLPPPCAWHPFAGGELVDVAGGLTLTKDLSHDQVGWRHLLAGLRRAREQRPIDGVILTLSAIDLLAWEHRSSAELRAIGDGLADRLREASEVLGVSFPVYVVLTKADELPCFSAVQSLLPDRYRQNMVGWSTPYAVDASFTGAWIEEGLETVATRLTVLTAEILAGWDRPTDALSVVRAPDEIRHLAPATRAILSQVFGSGAGTPPCFLRGIYFGARAATPDGAETGRPGAAPDAPPPGDPIAFVGDLFERKVFPERGMARAVKQRVMESKRSIRWLRIAATALVLVGMPGMWVARAGLRRRVQPLEEVLSSVGQDLSIVSGAGGTADGSVPLSQAGEGNVVSSLLKEMASVDVRPVRSIFLPSSWFSSLDDEVTDSLATGFRAVILPTLRQGIVDWTHTMSDEGWAQTIGGRVPLDDGSEPIRSSGRFQEYEVLVRYLSEIRQFAENADLFNQIAQGGTSDVQLFSGLYAWYYERELPREFVENHAFYKRALAGASERPVSAAEWPGFEVASARVATDLADRFYMRLVDAVGGLKQSLAGTADPDFSAADLRVLWQDVGQVQDLLTSSDGSWFDAGAPLPPALRAELDSIPVSELFHRATFGSQFVQGFDGARRRHLDQLSRELELLAQALLVANTADPWVGWGPRIAPQLATLRSALGDLLNRGFMAPTPDTGEQMGPTLAGRPTWNGAPLDEAVEYFNELQDFREVALKQIPASLRGLVLNVAGRSLEDRVRWCIGRAMTYEVGVGPEGRAGREEDLQQRLASFDAAARRLVAMLAIDDKMGGTPAGAAVSETVILEGSDLLNQVDELLTQEQLYNPVHGSLTAWRGDRPASFAGFGVSSDDALLGYLDRERARLHDLSGYASGILAYLALPPVAGLLRSDGQAMVPATDGLVRRWRDIGRGLDDYNSRVPGNPLAALEAFVIDDMAIATVPECAQVAQQSAGAKDYFGQLRARLSSMLVDRCRALRH